MTITQRVAAALGTFVFFLGLAPLVAHAAPLTPLQVERYIASVPELKALGEKHDQKSRRVDRARPLGSSLELMGKESPAYADLAQLAARHEFSSAEQWADVGDRTTQAYIILKSGLSSDEVEAGYKQGIVNVNNDASLTAAKKQAVLKGMEKGHKRNMAARQAAEKDLPAVRPHMAALDKLME